MQNDSTNGRLRSVNILDYLVVLAKYKRFILFFVMVSILLAVVLLYFVLPRWYKATAVVMPPKQKSISGLLNTFSRATAPLRGLGLAGGSDDLSQFQTILKSRRSLDAVIERFNLIEVYQAKNIHEARKELEDNVALGLGKEDVSLEVSVFDTDAQRAADMANFFVSTLNSVYLELTLEEARSNREFLEKRYHQNLAELKAAEDSLKHFQRQYGIYSLVEALSGKNLSSFVPYEKVPDVVMRYLELTRDLEIQHKILEIALPLYEQVRLEEQRNTPTVVVLDVAVPPDKPSKPRRLTITAIVAAGSFLLAYLFAFFFSYVERARLSQNQEDEEKLKIIRERFMLKNLFR